MPGPKEEWEIWDRRFQFAYSCLNERLKINEEAMQKLDQKTQNLAANSKHLEETNDGLKDGVQKLEQASCQNVEQVQDLTASSRSLKEEINILNHRILQLEQEGTRREEENRLAQEQLKEQISAQEQDFRSVIVAMRGMHETGSAERAQRGEEIQRLRSQLEALIAPRLAPRGATRAGGSGLKAASYAEVSVTSCIASRRPSQATTEDEDERTPINQHAKQQQQQQEPHADIEVQGMLIKAQDRTTSFEDHLWYAETVFTQHETEAVVAFMGSIQERYRKLLMHKLGERGEWTWQAAREEGHKIIHTEKKVKSRSARLIATPS